MMELFPELSGGSAVLLSIKPRYADLILSGSKRVELRRSWPSRDIGVMVLYSSSPVQKLVGVAYVDTVKETDPDGLWELASDYGGGVTREELADYCVGKKLVYGIMIKNTRTADVQVDPKDIFPDFVPPQSFQYLEPMDFQKIMNLLFSEG